MGSTPLVSIIVPVFKAENNIEKCACSWFEQTFEEIEYIFVDDSSPDGSVSKLMKVIADYPHREKQVTIMHHGENRGVAAARNTGLKIARGEYFLQADSDDWAEPSLVEEMYNKAKSDDSDMVWSDYYVDFPDSGTSVYRRQNAEENVSFYVKGMLAGSLHAGLWNKLMKRNVCIENNILFPDGVNMCEDLVFCVSYLLHVKNISNLQKAFYHYVQHPDSLTINKTRQSFESEFKGVKLVEAYLSKDIYGEYLMMLKARIKRNMFMSGMFGNEEYLDCYPESESFIYIGVNFIDKFAIWLSLKRMFLFARGILFFGQLYSKSKILVRSGFGNIYYKK